MSTIDGYDKRMRNSLQISGLGASPVFLSLNGPWLAKKRLMNNPA
jgi:hypothetical protein